MNSKKRILFVSHEASFTGAPILLLNLIALVQSEHHFDIRVLCVRDGAMKPAFSRLAPCSCLKAADMYHEESLFKRGFNKLLFGFRLIAFIPKWMGSDFVFNNTVGNGKVLRFFFRFRKLPVVSYIHELEASIRHAAANGEAQLTFDLSEKILSPSRYNQEILQQIFHIPPAKSGLLRYLIKTQLEERELGQLRELKQKSKQAFCKKHQLQPDALLILGMGTFDRRKAVDLFVQTAVRLNNPNFQFVWMGMSREPEFRQEVEQFIQEQGVTNFHYLGPVEHDLHHYLPFDLFFLSSREDPYPLVVLEAASVQIPTLCFSGSGGIIDFVTEENGWIAADFSPEKAARNIAQISTADISAKGLSAQSKVHQWHFDASAIYESFRSLTGWS
ncbi:MAG: glycosyltransferase [Bacteroidetes bacterium]|nr:glycosyltransferase [Bacteroidota bacterium]MBS1628735.1 glycosyltransferase [Bacteroidota bacterium]